MNRVSFGSVYVLVSIERKLMLEHRKKMIMKTRTDDASNCASSKVCAAEKLDPVACARHWLIALDSRRHL